MNLVLFFILFDRYSKNIVRRCVHILCAVRLWDLSDQWLFAQGGCATKVHRHIRARGLESAKRASKGLAASRRYGEEREREGIEAMK